MGGTENHVFHGNPGVLMDTLPRTPGQCRADKDNVAGHEQQRRPSIAQKGRRAQEPIVDAFADARYVRIAEKKDGLLRRDVRCGRTR